MKVLIIAEGGHGPETPGKRTPLFPDGTFTHEHEFNYPTSNRFLELCKNTGFEVLNVSNAGYDVPLMTRTDRANEAYKEFKDKYPQGVCLYVSFHYNALNGVFDDKKGGISTFHYPGARDSEKLDKYVQKELVKGTTTYDRGIKSADFHVLRETDMTAILIEAGFMDKLSEAKLMKNKNYQNEVATETLYGVLSYLKNERGVIVKVPKKSYEDEVEQATNWARANGLSDCTRLGDNITRQEAIVMFYRANNIIGGRLI